MKEKYVSSIPPRPLSLEEFIKRRKEGANTFAEVDPDFTEWILQRQLSRTKAIQFGLVVSTIAFFVFIVLISVLVIYTRK